MSLLTELGIFIGSFATNMPRRRRFDLFRRRGGGRGFGRARDGLVFSTWLAMAHPAGASADMKPTDEPLKTG